MRLLQKSAWDKFGKDGKLFEDLSLVLLEREFPSFRFTPTQPTRDGGKDFTAQKSSLEEDTRRIRLHADADKRDAPEKWWAESKSKGLTSRKDNVSLAFDDISKTMYMAYLEQVKRVVIFSYAPFNQDFWRYLNPSDVDHSFTVIGYAGEQLDNLIIKHLPPGTADFEHFFGAYRIAEEAAEGKGSTRIHLRRRSSDDAAHSEKPYCIGDVVEADLFAVNETNEKQTVEIAFPVENEAKLRPLNGFDKNGRANWTIEPHSGRSLIVRFRVQDYAERLCFPKFEAKWTNGDEKHLSIRGSIACTWLAETELIGARYVETFRIFDALAESSRASCLTVVGGSGTGKSRVLKELESARRCRFDLVCAMDTDVEESSAGLAVRMLVSQLERLPLLEADALTQLVNECELSERYLFVWKALYDRNFSVAEHLDELADYLVDALARSRTLLVLDNVQNYDATFLQLLNATVDRMQNTSSRSALVLSFNDDTIGFNRKAVDLLARLESLSASRGDQFGKHLLEGFTEDDALRYLDRCLSGGRVDADELLYDYKESLRFIIDTWGCNPFCLKQLMICMFYDKVLKRGQSARFYIADVGGFHRALNRLPNQLQGLLRHRLDQMVRHLRSHAMDEAAFYRFMALLAFIKTLPLTLYDALVGETDLLALAERTGFVRRDDQGCVSFVHRYLLKFVKEELDYHDRIPYRDFIAACDETGYADAYFTHYFIACGIAAESPLADSLVDKAVHQAVLDRIEPDLCMPFFKLLIPEIRTRTESFSNKKYLQVFSKAVGMATNNVGVAGQCELAEPLVDDFLTGSRVFEAGDLEPVFNVVCEYLRGSVTLGKQAASLVHAEALAEVIDARYGFSREADICRTRILDCQAIAYYKSNDIESGRERAEEYARIAERLQDDYFRARSDLLMGDVHYHADLAGVYREKTCLHWDRAYRRHRAAFGTHLETGFRDAAKINIYLKSLMGDLAMQKLEDVEQKARFIENCIGNSRMAYFEIKTRLVLTAYLLTSGGLERNRTLRLIDEAADKSLRYGNASSYASSFCMRGLAYYALGDNERASKCLQESVVLVECDVHENNRAGGWDYYLAGLLAAERFGEISLGNVRVELHGSRGKDFQDILASGSSPSEDVVEASLDQFVFWRFPGSRLSFPKL